jgi:hypothetical protein
MRLGTNGPFVVGFVSLLWLATAWGVNPYAQASDPPVATSLAEVDKDEDEFYAHVDEVISPTELAVTVLDVWNPLDKVRGPRWPAGKAKVKPARRIVILEETSAPNAAEQKKAALDFLRKTLKESDNEILCTGSNVSVRKKAGGESICVTGYVYVKAGFTLNNALLRQGLATTTNPFYKSWEQQAKQKKLGIWRDRP